MLDHWRSSGTSDLIPNVTYRGWMFLTALVVGLSMVFVGVAAAPASPPAAPVNDNYLSSLELNGPGTALNRTDTLKDVRDTTNATVQTNILDPCGRASCPAGPSEVTVCRGVNFQKTVWYDFYPNADGTARIRTAGFDNVIAVYPFSLQTAVPDASKQTCAHQSSFPSEELLMPVKKGRAYTIQIGGVNGVGGPLEFLFDFYPTPPHRLSAQSTLKAKALSSGIQLLGLSVTTARAAHVQVSCGRFCRSQAKTGQAVERFSGLNGVQMPAGSKLQIRVTAPHSIGVYIEYDIQRGNFTKHTGCMEPGSRKPQRSCH